MNVNRLIAVWMAFALEAQTSSKYLEEALHLLSPVTIKAVRTNAGKNELLGRACRTRILRRLGRVREAQEE